LTPIRVLGSVFSLLTGLSVAFVLPRGLESASDTGITRLGGLVFIIGAVLAIFAVASFVVPRITFIVSAILSASVLLTVAVRFGRFNQDVALVTAVLATVALVTDAFAARPSKGLSEKDSPLNLPVFG
jgi:uncharacterized membrane protein